MKKYIIIFSIFLIIILSVLISIYAVAGKKPAYIIQGIKVHDQKTFQQFADTIPRVIAKYGGEVLVYGNSSRNYIIEGDPKLSLVVIKFKNIEAAQRCYDSPEHQAVIGYRKKSSTGWMVIAEQALPFVRKADMSKSLPGYIIQGIKIHDQETFDEFAKRVPKVIMKYKGSMLVHGKFSKFIKLEGDPGNALVIIRYKSVDQAQRCYDSLEHQAIVGYRKVSSTGWMIVAEQFMPKKK